ncbi:MAG: transcriptional regulator [Bacteroidota bacterium]|nr:transcriptional regulator [Bacteroidota bacterium]
MKSIIEDINKVFENRVRLGIMSALTVQQNTDFNYLKKLLQVTDGNLAGHLRKLEKMEYIKVYKKFTGRKPHTTYDATEKGTNAFKSHIDALEKLINQSKQ